MQSIQQRVQDQSVTPALFVEPIFYLLDEPWSREHVRVPVTRNLPREFMHAAWVDVSMLLSLFGLLVIFDCCNIYIYIYTHQPLEHRRTWLATTIVPEVLNGRLRYWLKRHDVQEVYTIFPSRSTLPTLPRLITPPFIPITLLTSC